MEGLLSLIPKDRLLYELIGVLLPTIVAFLLYLKQEKDQLIAKIEDEVDDVFGDLTESLKLLVDAQQYIEDAVEFVVESLQPESEEGRVLSEAEKTEALAQVEKALVAAKGAIAKLRESIVIGD
jgi:hypothetical protein